MKDSDKEIYETLKMRVNPHTECGDYSSTMRFWRAVESKYQERKRKWIEANARMVAAKMAAIKARRELLQMQREQREDQACQSSRSASPISDVEYVDAKDDEFSDVDTDMFIDPVDRYYSSMDAEAWEKIRNDLMKAHQYTFDRKKRIMRRVFLVIMALLWLLVGGLYFLYKTTTNTEAAIGQTTGCLFKCDQKTIVEEFIQMIFTSAATDEEI